MAARKNRVKLDPAWRERIRTSMLLNRLQDFAEGKIELKNGQVKAIDVLLKKTIPDLSSVQHAGADGGALVVNIVRQAADADD